MLSKISSLNKAMFNNLSKQITFITIINVICTFFLIPFSYYLNSTNSSEYGEIYQWIIGGSIETTSLFFVGTTGYALLAAALMTYFLKSPSGSDFIHSLPVKRSTILTTMYTVFLSHMAFNLVLNSLLCVFFKLVYDISLYKIVIWCVMTLIYGLFIFSITIVTGLLINQMLSHIFQTGLLLSLTLVISFIVNATQEVYFFGLIDDLLPNMAYKLSMPISVLYELQNETFSIIYWVILLLLSGVFIALSYYLYSKRRNEFVTHSYSSLGFQSVLYMITVTFLTLFFGMLFLTFFPKMLPILIIVYIISFLLTYFGLEMLEQKSVKIEINKGVMLSAFISTALAVMLIFFIGNYREHYVPKINDIEGTRVNFGTDDELTLLNEVESHNEPYNKAVIRAHQYVIKHAEQNTDSYNMFTITYRLKDGKTINRHYPLDEKTFKYVSKVVDKNKYYGQLVEDINWEKFYKSNISILKSENMVDNEGKTMLLKGSNKLEFIKALRSDLKRVNDNDHVVKNAATNMTVDFEMEDEIGGKSYITMQVTPYHHNILKFLVDKEYIKRPSDIYSKGEFMAIESSNKLKDIQVLDDETIARLDTKKVERENILNKIDSYKASPNGQKLYYFNGENMYHSLVIID